MEILTHLSEKVLERLRDDVPRHLDRYGGTGFEDLAAEPGWTIATRLEFDHRLLADLDGSSRTSAADVANSRIVWRALSRLSPSVANEERIWVRLSHVEAFPYSRDRWLPREGSDEDLAKMVHLHLFAAGQTGVRDDHSISRLWWNGYIASQYWPHDPDRGLELLLLSADVRSNIVERPWLSARKRLAKGIFRALNADTGLGSHERQFREFMKKVNLLGAGIVFEAMSEADIDRFLENCRNRADEALEVAATK